MALANLVAGLALGLWAFGAFSYAAKLAQRPGVLWDDLKVMPARAGLAAATMGGMAAAAVLSPFAPRAAGVVLALALALHAGVALAVVRVLLAGPPEGRVVNPGWHLVFTGFIVGAQSAAVLGWQGLAVAIFWPTVVAALAIWAASATQLARHPPPAPLRPMLAIHLAPASLFTSVAALTGQPAMAMLFATVALAVSAALVLSARWLLAAGFSPLWGALTFPLAAFAAAAIRMGGAWTGFGLGLAVLASVAVPAIGWGVLRMWPKGTLAARTNAAEA
jgi:tellurite resistance protein